MKVIAPDTLETYTVENLSALISIIRLRADRLGKESE